jgi:hypothetical protein
MIYITRKFLIILISIGVCSPFMLFAEDFPKSCKEIKELNNSSLNGIYTIVPDGKDNNKPLEVYCDMESDKVGLTFYLVKNGITTRKVTDNDSCQKLGLEIFAPRIKDDYENARKYLLSINAAQSFGPLGVYHPTFNKDDWWLPFGWTSFTPMNSEYAGRLFGWKSTAGDIWWISNSSSIFEPNGDYYKNCWLDISYDDSGKVDWYNDERCDFSYNTYLCMSADNYAPPSPPPCQLYVVQDDGLNDSLFFTINPNTLEIRVLGKYYPAHDIEALDAHPDTDALYAASGDNTERPGYLYKVNKKTGALKKIGSTGFAEIEGLSFHNNGTLWGWAKGDGLIKINPKTAASQMIISTDIQVEDLTWNNDGTLLYVAQDTHLLVYDRVEIKKACDLPGHTEALEMLPDNTLLVGIHGQKKLLDFQVINLETCETVIGVGIPTEYDDVEGIAWPAKVCSQ